MNGKDMTKRLVALLPVVILSAVVLGIGANVLALDDEWVLALGAAALALLASLGTLWIIGFGFGFGNGFKGPDRVHFHKSAVPTGHKQRPISDSEGMSIPRAVHRRQKNKVIVSQPVKISTRRAIPDSAALEENRRKGVVVEHRPILSGHGSN
jgi:hypothetical protein